VAPECRQGVLPGPLESWVWGQVFGEQRLRHMIPLPAGIMAAPKEFPSQCKRRHSREDCGHRLPSSCFQKVTVLINHITHT
jgi:hypothetical protein